MPITTNEAFERFDDALKLDPAQRIQAEKIHNEITAILQEAGLIVSAFLQGSFARKTMIAPLRDVVKVVILDPSLSGLTPDEVMDRIERCLGKPYPDVRFDRTRHSLQIDFGEDTFYFDTVPSWESTTDDDDICIANRDTYGWQRSNSRELMRMVAKRNSDTGGLFIHQVRMGKQAIKELVDGIVPGLHVESWAYIEITEAIAFDEAVTLILEAGARLLGGNYTEPTGVDTISARLKPEIIAEAKPVLAEAARRAHEARALTAAGDHNEAIRIWRSMLGDCFPEPEEQDDATALRNAFHGGTVTSEGAVSSTGAGRQVARPTRSWKAS